MVQTKKCSKCKKVKDIIDFSKDSQKIDGLRSDCKICVRVAYFKKNNKEFKEQKLKPAREEGKKYCPKCDKNVLFSDFNKDISTKSGLESCCKVCKLLYKQSIIKICGVYKITSPDGHIYIGSSLDIKNRWSSYKKSRQLRIKESFNKYGVDNHIFEIIEECLEEDLKCRERYWQDFYDVLGENGLNDILEKCGEKGQVFSQRLKNRIRSTNTGKKQSDYTIRKRIENSPLTKLVLDLYTGIFYYSIKEAADAFNMSSSTLYYQLMYAKINKTNLIMCDEQ